MLVRTSKNISLSQIKMKMVYGYIFHFRYLTHVNIHKAVGSSRLANVWGKIEIMLASTHVLLK